MSLQLRLLDLWLRLVTRPRLARTRTPEEMRRRLETAARAMPAPRSAARLVADGPEAPRPSGAGAPPAPNPGAPRLLWAVGPNSDPDRVVLYFHGGAYLAGSPETHRSILLALADEAKAVVAAPDYRLAPEHPFPAAVEDAEAAFEALLARGWPAGRIALAGESAGAGLALALLGERQRRGLAGPGAIVAFSPFADLTLSSPSLRRFARREAMLPVQRMADAAAAYLGGADPADPRASPVFATFSSPPPALIQAGRREALRDDATRMAEALRAAGGEVRLELWPGAPHGFQFFVSFLPEARRALAHAGAFLREKIPSQEPVAAEG